MTLIANLVAMKIAASVAAVASSAAIAEEWRFKVTLDGKPIGYHHFQLTAADRDAELLSEARFDVKLLFITVYRYAHESRERWRHGCLQRISAQTNDNGERNSVDGQLGSTSFRLTTKERTADLDACVMTFAYWNPQILDATHLLNPQTGEYVPVRASRIGFETISALGVERLAERYRLFGDAKIGGRLEIDLWYSAERQWLALESRTEDGRRLRYQLQ